MIKKKINRRFQDLFFIRTSKNNQQYISLCNSSIWQVSQKTNDSFYLSEVKQCKCYLGLCCSSLKMWTVSVLLEAHRNCASALKDNELMLTYLIHKQQTQKDTVQSELRVYFHWNMKVLFKDVISVSEMHVNWFILNYVKVWAPTFSSLAGIQTASVLQECWILW